MFLHEVTGMCDCLHPTPSTQRPAAQYFLPLVAKQREACCQNVIKINKTGNPHPTWAKALVLSFIRVVRAQIVFQGGGGPFLRRAQSEVGEATGEGLGAARLIPQSLSRCQLLEIGVRKELTQRTTTGHISRREKNKTTTHAHTNFKKEINKNTDQPASTSYPCF